MLRKNQTVFLIFLLELYFLPALLNTCKRPTTPDVPEETGGEVEFLYQRIFEVTNSYADLTKGSNLNLSQQIRREKFFSLGFSWRE